MSSQTPEHVDLSEPLTSVEALRALLGDVHPSNLRKVRAKLDDHCRRFIALSPMLFMGSSNSAGQCDVSPKGDAPGFARVLSDTQLAIPDRKGNARADTMQNIL